MIATILGREIVKYGGGQFGPALGAARLAIVAKTGAAIETVCTAPREQQPIEPDSRLVDAYRDRHVRYRALYQSLKDRF